MKEQLAPALIAAVFGEHVARAGFDVAALVELLIVVAIAVSNWIWKRKKDKDNLK